MIKRKTYYLLLGLISMLLSSCGASFTINGSTDGSMADGQKYLLTAFTGNEMKDIDSCDVVHGQFSFAGSVDSVKLALIVSDDFILPVIIEEGEISVSINSKTGTEVSGTKYNDILSNFRKELDKIETEYNDLSNRQLQGIKNGEDEDSLNTVLTQEARIILERKESLIKKFICDNFDTPLAAAAFQGLTIVPFMMQNGYAELSPWIDEILTKANDDFKKDPYVKFYVERAKVVEGIMNGTIEAPGQQQTQPQNQQQIHPTDSKSSQTENTEETAPENSDDRLQELEGTVPTPNELAKPSK